MTLFDALILGLVEGLTEFLPVSSTGHLLLAQKWLGLPSSAGLDAYLIVIQIGAILAVLALYPHRAGQLFLGVDACLRRKWASPHFRLLSNLFVAFLPAAVMGLLLDGWIENHLFQPLTVALALAFGGIVMLWLGRKEGKAAVDEFGIKGSLTVGLWQVASLWPGMSRSMTTLVAGCWCGLTRAAAAEFSFLLGALVLSAAGLYKFVKMHESILAMGAMPIAVGIAAGFISALVVVKFLVAMLNRFGLAPWAWYRLAAAAVIVWIAR